MKIWQQLVGFMPQQITKLSMCPPIGQLQILHVIHLYVGDTGKILTRQNWN